MEIRVLRYFLAIAREGSITNAANFLHVTQPTLSRQIRELEEELGQKLFVRKSHSMTLTNEGMILRKRAEEIVSMVDKTEAEFSSMENIIGGDIYIGGGETDAMRLIARAAKEFQALHPQVRYHLFSGNAEDVTERLDKGLLDFGVLIEPADLKKYDLMKLPATDVWGVLIPKDSPLAARDTVRKEDLWDLPLLVSRQSLGQNEIYTWLGRNVEALNIVTTYNLIYNAALMVEEGMGYALTLDRLVNTAGDSKLCFRPLEPRQEVGLDIVWKKYQVFSRATEKFLEYLQEKFMA